MQSSTFWVLLTMPQPVDNMSSSLARSSLPNLDKTPVHSASCHGTQNVSRRRHTCAGIEMPSTSNICFRLRAPPPRMRGTFFLLLLLLLLYLLYFFIILYYFLFYAAPGIVSHPSGCCSRSN